MISPLPTKALQASAQRSCSWAGRAMGAAVIGLLASAASGFGPVWAQGLSPLPGTSSAGAGTSSVVQTEQVRAELVAHAPQGVAPGQPMQLGLKIEHAPHWHTYWKNPGDSGLPTTLTWALPAGLQAGDIQWPTPRKLPVGPLMNYGYENTVLLPVPVTVTAAPTGSNVELRLSAQWLVCKEVCIPQEGSFVLRLPAQASTAGHAALFEATENATPKTIANTKAIGEVGTDFLKLRVLDLPATWHGKAVDFFVEMAGVVNHAAKPETAWRDGAWDLRVPLSPERFESPTRLDAVLTTPGQTAGVRVSFDVKGTWPAVPGTAAHQTAGATSATVEASTPAQASTAAGTPTTVTETPMGLIAALLSALVGGLLLNLMPCVLPVLSLKVLGLAQHRDESARLRVGTGVAYTMGVLMSFLALAALMLALRASGQAVGWGFQLQSPGVIVALAVLFTLIGLNLAGVFEMALVLPGSAAGMRLRHPFADAWLTGVLAVAVAAPCTAPFMGAALGYAISLPAGQALAVFAALGLGLALPFLAVTLMPGLARWLPKPGAWMERFKVAMAFPMFATVVWLVWVLGQQVGIDGAAALLGVLVVLAFAMWAVRQRGARGVGRVAWPAVAAVSMVAALAWALPTWRSSSDVASDGGPSAPVAGASGEWQPWSTQAVAEHNAAGRAVFVDFTAAWCVTCQVNKRTTLGHADVKAALARHGVVTMRADWTRADPRISAELTRLGRTGVPVYAIYRAGQPLPQLLPEVLTPAGVVQALDTTRHTASR